MADLIDLAEAHNPETRVAWEGARAQAAALGIARSELFPTLAAVALAGVDRHEAAQGSQFYRQTIPAFQVSLDLSYTIFDFDDEHSARMLEEMADRIEHDERNASNSVEDSHQLLNRTLEAIEEQQPASARSFATLIRGIDRLTTSLAMKITHEPPDHGPESDAPVE